jgi:hypothetical protein
MELIYIDSALYIKAYCPEKFIADDIPCIITNGVVTKNKIFPTLSKSKSFLKLIETLCGEKKYIKRPNIEAPIPTNK